MLSTFESIEENKENTTDTVNLNYSLCKILCFPMMLEGNTKLKSDVLFHAYVKTCISHAFNLKVKASN